MCWVCGTSRSLGGTPCAGCVVPPSLRPSCTKPHEATPKKVCTPRLSDCYCQHARACHGPPHTLATTPAPTARSCYCLLLPDPACLHTLWPPLQALLPDPATACYCQHLAPVLFTSPLYPLLLPDPACSARSCYCQHPLKCSLLSPRTGYCLLLPDPGCCPAQGAVPAGVARPAIPTRLIQQQQQQQQQ